MASFTALRSSMSAPSTACSNSGACGGNLPASSEVFSREEEDRRAEPRSLSWERVEENSAMERYGGRVGTGSSRKGLAGIAAPRGQGGKSRRARALVNPAINK